MKGLWGFNIMYITFVPFLLIHLVWQTEEGGRVSQSSDGGPAKDSEQAEKKGHRRNQSLGSYFTSFVTKRTASVPINLDKAVSQLLTASLWA